MIGLIFSTLAILSCSLSGVAASSSETLYQQQEAEAAKALDEKWRGRHRKEEDSFPALWDMFEPFYNCHLKERVGELGDGGKWMCDLHDLKRLHRRCVVYSFGSSGIVGFEKAVIAKTNCDVYIFDPTMSKQKEERVKAIPGVTFVPTGLYSEETTLAKVGKVAPLKDLMKMLKHDHVDILKVDIEGSEWPAFNNAIWKEPNAPFSQLLIELHHIDINTTIEFFDGAKKHGFRIFSKEPNLYGFLYHPRNQLFEYGFIKRNFMLRGGVH